MWGGWSISMAAELAARCDEAARCRLAIARVHALQGRPEQSSSPTPDAPPSRRVWATLLTNAAYVSGVKALHNSLLAVESAYALVVMITSGVPAADVATLTEHGCELLTIEVLPLPAGKGDQVPYMSPQFAECWTKLRVWQQVQFERVVLLDADMIVLKNMDELLDGNRRNDVRQACEIEAVHECFCAVKRGDTPCAHHHSQDGPLQPSASSYFNAGLIALTPSIALFEHMLAALAAIDLSACAFAEQDFLNAYFLGCWRALPWVYNATKTLYACHRPNINGCDATGMWSLPEVRNLHFTMAKPWDLRHPLHKGFERLNTLWFAAFAEPDTLVRVLLKVHLQEKREQREQRGQREQQQQQQPAGG